MTYNLMIEDRAEHDALLKLLSLPDETLKTLGFSADELALISGLQSAVLNMELCR